MGTTELLSKRIAIEFARNHVSCPN